MKTPQQTDNAFPPPGDPRLLSDIQRRTPKTSGGGLYHLPGGIALDAGTIRRAFPYVLPFHPVAFSTTNGNTTATLKPGLVIVRHILRKNDPEGPLPVLEPSVGLEENSMWDTPTPPLTLQLDSSNRSWNYLTCNTDTLGNPLPTSNVTFRVQSFSANQESNHHIPRDPLDAEGSNGVYYIPLFETNFDATNTADRLTLRWGGHYYFDQALWEGAHKLYSQGAGFDPTAGARPFEEFDEENDIYYFRTHIDLHGHNCVENASTIEHKFVGENIGSSSGNTAVVYTGNTSPDAAQFNIIAERATGPAQVRISQGTNESPVRVTGNDNNGNINFLDCNSNVVATLTFVDGLWTNNGNISIQLGECSGNV